jgi:hypothetical protein
MLGIQSAWNSRGQMTLRSITAEDNCLAWLTVWSGVSSPQGAQTSTRAPSLIRPVRRSAPQLLQPVCLVFIISPFLSCFLLR